MNGKLIVIEGSDGSGKTTQLEFLKKYFETAHIPFNSIKFPRYNDSFFGKTIAAYLKGELGDLSNINPYLISIVYAMDRAEAKDILNGWLEAGDIVIMDRYATSNMAHQYARLPDGEKEKFLQWELELEYSVNKIPKEDLVIFLHVPYAVSQKLVAGENRDRAYAEGMQKDIHEKDTEFLKKSEEAYLHLAQKFPHWVTIECIDENGELKSREEIHKEIISILKEKEIIAD